MYNKIIPLLFLFVVTIHSLYAQESGSQLTDPTTIAMIEDRVHAIVADSEYVSVSLSIAKNGQLIYSDAAGYQDLTQGIKANPNTLYRIYSTMKPVTSIAALKLQEQGILDINVPISDYIKTLPPHIKNITSFQLMAHLSGIRHYKNNEWQEVSSYTCQSPKEALKEFINDPLESEPGEKYVYSSFAYVLLSVVLEEAAGKPVEQIIDELIEQPTGATLELDNPNKSIDHRAQPYELWQGTMYEARQADITCKFGGGGFLGNAETLARIGSSLLSGNLLSDASVARMFSNAKEGLTSSRPDLSLSFSFVIEKDENNRTYAWSSGGARGGRSAWIIYPEQQLVVSLAANTNGRNLREDARAIAQVILDNE